MEQTFRRPSTSGQNAGPRTAWPWIITAGCLLVVMMGLLLPRLGKTTASGQVSANAVPRSPAGNSAVFRRVHSAGHRVDSGPTASAEEIVATKLSQFAQSRRAIARAMAKQLKIEVPADVERFFDAAESGRWGEIKSLWDTLSQQRRGSEGTEELRKLWPAVMETYGVAEIAHLWPAQQVLDYGEAVLSSLRPGMVYVGGTDAGRFIPTLLNETADSERHIILTQNALADGTYLNYLSFLNKDRMTTLTAEDSQQIFKDYIADAQKRLAHDQEFPQEPKQIRPGEDVRVTDDRVQVSGQVAVMMINEKLLETLMNENPGLSFALQESFPFRSTYPDAVPLGPIMELRAQDTQTSFTADTVAKTLDYWRTTSQELLAGTETSGNWEVLNAYSKLATAQAGLLAAHDFSAQAEQTYRLATEICPSTPDAVLGYVNLLLGQQRFAEAVPVVETAAKAAPDNQQFRNLLETLKTRVKDHRAD